MYNICIYSYLLSMSLFGAHSLHSSSPVSVKPDIIHQWQNLNLPFSFDRFLWFTCYYYLFLFFFSLHQGVFPSFPTTPGASLFWSSLHGTPISIMSSAHQAHVETVSLCTAGAAHGEKTQSHISVLPLVPLISSFSAALFIGWPDKQRPSLCSYCFPPLHKTG